MTVCVYRLLSTVHRLPSTVYFPPSTVYFPQSQMTVYVFRLLSTATDLFLCTGGPSVREAGLRSGFSLLSTQGGWAGGSRLLFASWRKEEGGRRKEEEDIDSATAKMKLY